MAAKRNVDSGRVDSLGRRIKVSGKGSTVSAKKNLIDSSFQESYNKNGEDFFLVYLHSPNSPSEVMDFFAEKGHPSAVKHNNTSDTGLKFIVADYYDNTIVMSQVASHPNAGNDTLTVCMGHPEPYVRAGVARNTSEQAKFAVRMMVDDEDSDVRNAVADNPSLTDSDIEKLANDPDVYVRCAVLRNPHASGAVIDGVIRGKEGFRGLDNAMRNDNIQDSTIEYIASHAGHWGRVVVSKSEKATPAALRSIYAKEKNNLDVLVNLIGNKNCPPDVISDIATHHPNVTYHR